MLTGVGNNISAFLSFQSAYVEHKEIRAAIGVKIAAKELEKAIAGLNLLVAQQPDEVEILKEEVERLHANAINAIKLKERGVFVQASTLGSLEALVEFLKESKIPVSKVEFDDAVLSVVSEYRKHKPITHYP